MFPYVVNGFHALSGPQPLCQWLSPSRPDFDDTSSSSSTPSVFLRALLPCPDPFARTHTEKPHHSFLFNPCADPPTATLQRINALVTGTIPTFMGVGHDFGGASIAEGYHTAAAPVEQDGASQRQAFLFACSHQSNALCSQIAFMTDDT